MNWILFYSGWLNGFLLYIVIRYLVYPRIKYGNRGFADITVDTPEEVEKARAIFNSMHDEQAKGFRFFINGKRVKFNGEGKVIP